MFQVRRHLPKAPMHRVTDKDKSTQLQIRQRSLQIVHFPSGDTHRSAEILLTQIQLIAHLIHQLAKDPPVKPRFRFQARQNLRGCLAHDGLKDELLAPE